MGGTFTAVREKIYPEVIDFSEQDVIYLGYYFYRRINTAATTA
jgi:hypothetical protein